MDDIDNNSNIKNRGTHAPWYGIAEFIFGLACIYDKCVNMYVVTREPSSMEIGLSEPVQLCEDPTVSMVVLTENADRRAYHIGWRHYKTGVQRGVVRQTPLLEISTGHLSEVDRRVSEGKLMRQCETIAVECGVGYPGESVFADEPRSGQTEGTRYMQATLTPDGEVRVYGFIVWFGHGDPVPVALSGDDFCGIDEYNRQTESRVAVNEYETALSIQRKRVRVLRDVWIGKENEANENKSFGEDIRCSRMRITPPDSTHPPHINGTTMVVVWGDEGVPIAVPLPIHGISSSIAPIWSHLCPDWVNRGGDPSVRLMHLPVTIYDTLNGLLEVITETDRCVRWVKLNSDAASCSTSVRQVEADATSIRLAATVAMHRLMVGYVHSNGEGILSISCCCPHDAAPSASFVADPCTFVRQIYVPGPDESEYVEMGSMVGVRPRTEWSTARSGQFMLPTSVFWLPATFQAVITRNPGYLAGDTVHTVNRDTYTSTVHVTGHPLMATRTCKAGKCAALQATCHVNIHPQNQPHIADSPGKMVPTGGMGATSASQGSRQKLMFRPGCDGVVTGVDTQGGVHMTRSLSLTGRTSRSSDPAVVAATSTLNLCCEFLNNCPFGVCIDTSQSATSTALDTLEWGKRVMKTAADTIATNVDVNKSDHVELRKRARVSIEHTLDSIQHAYDALLPGDVPTILPLHKKMFDLLGPSQMVWVLAAGSDGLTTDNRAVLLVQGLLDAVVVYVRRDTLIDPEFISRHDPTDAARLHTASSVRHALSPGSPQSVTLVGCRPYRVCSAMRSRHAYFVVKWYTQADPSCATTSLMRVGCAQTASSDAVPTPRHPPVGRFMTKDVNGKTISVFNPHWGITKVNDFSSTWETNGDRSELV